MNVAEKVASSGYVERIYRRAFVAGLTVVGLVFPLFMAALGAQYPASREHFLIWGTTSAVVMSGFWALSWHSSIRVYRGGLAVTNIFVRYWVPWPLVREVVIDYGLKIRLRHGEAVGSIQFGGSLIGEFLTGYRTYRPTARRLEEARVRAQAESISSVGTGDAGLQWRVAVPWKAFLVIFAVLEGLAVLGTVVMLP